MNVIGHCSQTHPHHEITCKSAHSHNYATREHFPTEYSSRHPPPCPNLSAKTNKKKRNAENAKSKTTAHTHSGGKPTIALCNQRSSVCDSVQTWGGGQPPLSGDVPLTPGHSCRSPRIDRQINKDLPGFLVNTCTIHDPTSLSLSFRRPLAPISSLWFAAARIVHVPRQYTTHDLSLSVSLSPSAIRQ